MDHYPPYDPYHHPQQQPPHLPYHPVPLQSPPLQPQTQSLPSFSLASKEGLLDSPADAQHAQQKARSKTPFAKIFLYSIGVLALTLLPTAVLLLYIFVVNTSQRLGMTILTTANLQNILAITQVITTVVTKSVGLVCTVWAYQSAAQWLKSSQQPGGADRPSPLQLGLLISVLQGASIVTWFKSRYHIARISEDSKRHALKVPGILSSAIFVLGVLLVLSNGLTATDTWLHLSSRATTVSLNSPYPTPGQANYGRVLNETLCTFWQSQVAAASFPTTYDLCGLITQSAGSPFRNSLPEGLRTMTNSSDQNRVAFTTDNHAILVPATVPSDISYIASTTGVSTTCASISNQCITLTSQGFYDGSDAGGVNFDCSKAHPYVNVSTANAAQYGGLNSEFGVVNSTNGNLATHANAAQSNPFMFAGVIVSSAYSDVTGRWLDAKTDGDWIANTGFFSYESVGGINIMVCNITVSNLQYRYSVQNVSGVPTYETISATTAPIVNATRLGSMTFAQSAGGNPIMQQRVAAAVEGTGIEDGDYAGAFAIEFSRELMALSASIYQPHPVEDVVTQELKFGSKIRLAPLAVYVGLTVLYCLTVLVIAVMAIFKSRGTPYVHLAQFRITSPLALLHELFGPVDSARTWKEDGLGLFSKESEADRLLVGAVATPKGDVAFGVTRQPPGAY